MPLGKLEFQISPVGRRNTPPLPTITGKPLPPPVTMTYTNGGKGPSETIIILKVRGDNTPSAPAPVIRAYTKDAANAAFHDAFINNMYGIKRVKATADEFKLPRSAPLEAALNYRFITPNCSFKHRFVVLSTYDPVTPSDIPDGIRKRIAAMSSVGNRTDILFRLRPDKHIHRKAPNKSYKSTQAKRLAWVAANIVFTLENKHTARWRWVQHHLDYKDSQRWLGLVINPLGLDVTIHIQSQAEVTLPTLHGPCDIYEFNAATRYNRYDFKRDADADKKEAAMRRHNKLVKGFNSYYKSIVVCYLIANGYTAKQAQALMDMSYRQILRYKSRQKCDFCTSINTVLQNCVPDPVLIDVQKSHSREQAITQEPREPAAPPTNTAMAIPKPCWLISPINPQPEKE